MWRELNGHYAYAAGASGTVTLPEGAAVIQILAYSVAGGTVTIFGGTAIPVVANSGFVLAYNHTLNVAPSSNKTIVFTATDSYFVEYVGPGQ